ncbi:hypothetical protein H7J71_23055 [Mycolicibacterium peregrinum]|uniref:hypothetical protein n=1 Tax=Mycolicibacterium peregrinum TaxID=43304 RepID=UPI0006D7E327|nr:hypothetical protein [Mycolicibacterium peregrinum]MCV7204897.1 hypothetical protein [Mycolicibacterium peregrinum]ORW59523.1 hypothetical protein AWC21_12480 [Mycolicibacterium peregrinum]
MNETAQRILTAERHITQVQLEQLAWAQTNPEAEAALHAARTRAVLKVAARMNATTEELDYLRLVVADAWSVAGERAGMLLEDFDTSLEEFSCGEKETYSRLTCTLFVVLDLWPDVVAETAEWARRHASTRE